MCSPEQGAMAGLQLGSSFMAQQGAADLQEIQNRAATRGALQALGTDREIVKRGLEEAREAKGQTDFDRKRQAMELQASANVSAAEGGVEGVSVERVMNNIRRQEGEVAVRTNKTYQSRLAAVGDRYDKSVANMVSRIQGLPPVVKPNLLASVISVTAPYVASGALEFDELNLFGGDDGGGGK